MLQDPTSEERNPSRMPAAGQVSEIKPVFSSSQMDSSTEGSPTSSQLGERPHTDKREMDLTRVSPTNKFPDGK
jgi:hypothetical protein